MPQPSVNGVPPATAWDAARYYRDRRGWVPTPNDLRGKKCFQDAWQTWTTATVDLDTHFPPGERKNVGVSLGDPSGGIVDIDLDCPEAVAAAGALLPPTGLRFGRAGRRGSHLLYRPAGQIRNKEYLDTVGGGAVLEVRATGRQTVFPPSTHESDEPVEWEDFGDPAEVPAADLEVAAAGTAAAALLARYWPGKGGRDLAYMALSGGLLRAEWEAGRVERFLAAVAAATGDEEWRKRERKAGATKAKFDDGKETTGWPRLEELMGEPGPAAGKLARAWLGLRPPSTRAAVRYVPLPDWKPFPVDCLPAPWAEFARQGAAALHCDPSYVALPALSVLAAAIGATRRVYVGPEWFEPAVVWTCVVGESGTVKSPAADLSVNLVKARQKKLMARYRSAVREYRQRLADWKKANTGGDAEGRPEPPRPDRVLVSDVTIEKLAGLLDDNQRGVLAYRDELAGWLGSFRRYKGKGGGSDEPNWLSIYRADSIIYDRKTGEKTSVYVPHAAVSVCGGIQPKVLARLVGQESFDSGLVARVMFAYPPRTPKEWSDDCIDPGVKAAAEASLDKLYDLSAEADDDGDPRPVLVKMDRPARDRFKRFVDEWGRRQFQADDELAAALAKLEGMAARLALVHHVTRADALEDADPIGLASVEAGIRIVEWAADEAVRVYMMLGESDPEREARRLVDLVRRVADRNGGRVTAQRLQNANSRKYRHREDAEADLDRLVGLGLGRWEDTPAGPRGGRPTRAFTLCTTHDFSDTTGDDPDPDGGAGVHDETPETPPGSGGADSGRPTEPVDGAGNYSKPVEPPAEVPSETSCVVQQGKAVVGSSGPVPATADPSEGSVVRAPGYVLVTTADALPVAAVEESARVGLDVETTGLDPHTDRVRLLTVDAETTDGGRQTYVIDCSRVDPAPLWEALSGVELVIHNAAFDLAFLARAGFTETRAVTCTLVLSRVLGAGAWDEKHTLAEVAKRYLGRDVSKAEQASDWSGTLTADQLAYAAADAAVLVPLLDAMTDRCRDGGTVRTAALESACTPAVAWLARSGVGFDAEAWGRIAAGAKASAAALGAEMDAAAPPNRAGGLVDRGWKWSSPRQVTAAFAAVGVRVENTADETLAGIDHPLAGLLRRYREQAKLATTYGPAWARKHVRPGGRVYASWNQLGAASGRMSCSDPNLQQLPRDERYRRCVVAPPGRLLVKADYSQIELRVAAKVAPDGKMLAAYQRGDDLHALTAKAILGKSEVTKADRQLAKAINFGLLFGMGYKSLVGYARANYGVTLTPGQARDYRAAFFREYPDLARWHDRVRRELGREKGSWYHARTVNGRKRTMRAHAQRADGTAYPNLNEALNSPVQGTAADGLKNALGLLWRRRADCPSAFPVLVVHDEVVVECDEADADRVKAWLTAAMVDGMTPFVAPVPVAVEATVGRTWGG